MNKSEQLIACLEGEIAKRDEELAACRISVENCDLFRARIAELEADRDSHQRYVMLTNLLARIHRDGGQYVKQHGLDKAFADADVIVAELYAAPVSEAKAQGVVQWPGADEIMQMAFEEGQPADDASGYCFELEEFDLFIERLMSEVARLNAAHVQQVSVPDGFCIGAWRDALEKIAKYAPQVNCAARTELERAGLIAVHALIAFSAPQFRHARGTQTASNAAPAAPSQGEQVRVVPVEPTEAMRKAAQDKLASEGLIVTDWLIHTAYSAMLANAPAAPAADAGHVFYGMDGNHP